MEAFKANPFLLAFFVIALEIPRYTFAIVVMAFFGSRNRSGTPDLSVKISVIVPAFNGAQSLRNTLDSISRSTVTACEILVINDGSDDDSASALNELSDQYPGVRVITHARRCGKSASINHAARIARGDLLAILDVDTHLAPDALAELSTAFLDPRVGAAGGNLVVANRKHNPLAALQSLEYLLGITVGRGFLNYLNALFCCSGAFSMFRTSVFRAVGGMNVGPGEDFEITLRLRKLGYRVAFVRSAIASTLVPETLLHWTRQRRRWSHDAINIRLFMYHQLNWPAKKEGLPDIFQRFDFVIMDLLPALIFPFYLAFLAVTFEAQFLEVFSAIYLALLGLYLIHLLLAMMGTERVPTLLELAMLPVMPLYQGIFSKLFSFFAYTEELVFASCHRDPFVPERVRNALYKGNQV